VIIKFRNYKYSLKINYNDYKDNNHWGDINKDKLNESGDYVRTYFFT